MAVAGLTELEQEFYKDLLVEPTPEVAVEEPTPEPETVVEPEPEPEPTPVAEPVVETVVPEYSGKKYIPLENEKEVYETLSKKYRYENMKPEEKALAFIAKENPGLDEDEILFIASSEYGIGVAKPDMDDLTDEQVVALRKQDIARKQLLNKADSYFNEEASKITLNGIDPLEDNEDFKSFRQQRTEQERIKLEQQRNYENTIKEVTNAVKSISELKVPAEIDIDDRKFAVDVTFKMDAEKQQKVIDYSKRYSPSDDEVKQFTDATTGKFDWKGYHSELANRLFYKEIAKAGLRQGLSQDREHFIEKELKNSTLRNNDVSQTVQKDFDIVDVWPFGR